MQLIQIVKSILTVMATICVVHTMKSIALVIPNGNVFVSGLFTEKMVFIITKIKTGNHNKYRYLIILRLNLVILTSLLMCCSFVRPSLIGGTEPEIICKTPSVLTFKTLKGLYLNSNWVSWVNNNAYAILKHMFREKPINSAKGNIL